MSPSNSWPGLHSQGLRAGIWELVGFGRLDRSETRHFVRSPFSPRQVLASTVVTLTLGLPLWPQAQSAPARGALAGLGTGKGCYSPERREKQSKKDDKVNQRNVNCEVYTVDDGRLGQLLAGPSVCSTWPPSCGRWHSACGQRLLHFLQQVAQQRGVAALPIH